MQLTGTITDEVLVTAAEEVVAIRQRQDQIADIAKQAEDNLKALAAERKAESITTTDGTVVTIVTAERRNFDAKIMADLVPASTFAMMTVVKVSATKYDAAVELGLVTDKEVAAAINPTPYVAIKINGGN